MAGAQESNDLRLLRPPKTIVVFGDDSDSFDSDRETSVVSLGLPLILQRYLHVFPLFAPRFL